MTGGLADTDLGPPIFVHVFPRSGGTLVTAMLDARMDTALCYELFETDLLAVARDLSIPEAVTCIRGAFRSDDPAASTADISHTGLRRLVRLGRRSGIEASDLGEEMERFATSGKGWRSVPDRLDFVEGLMRRKARLGGARHWGGKSKTSLATLLARQPEALLVKSIRDGRDVLASQLATGRFDPDPYELGVAWSRSVDDFLDLTADQGPHRAQPIPYERLVAEPASILREVCSALGLPYDPRMTTFSSAKLSLFENPHGQLSAGQLRMGIHTTSIGRWRRDLTDEQRTAFLDAAAGTLRRAGYDA